MLAFPAPRALNNHEVIKLDREVNVSVSMEAGLWIRIRINLSCWIRIQEGKMAHKYRKKLRIFMF
jgi:hypothetical protein